MRELLGKVVSLQLRGSGSTLAAQIIESYMEWTRVEADRERIKAWTGLTYTETKRLAQKRHK